MAYAKLQQRKKKESKRLRGEREPAWQEAILLLTHWTKDDLAFFMVLEQVLCEWMKEVLECWL